MKIDFKDLHKYPVLCSAHDIPCLLKSFKGVQETIGSTIVQNKVQDSDQADVRRETLSDSQYSFKDSHVA